MPVSGDDPNEDCGDVSCSGYFAGVTGGRCFEKADIAAGQFASGKATWTLKAPQEPGTYSMTAVMFYGTEKAAAGGAVKAPTGAELPKGGNFGASGRIMFSKPVSVTVR